VAILGGGCKLKNDTGQISLDHRGNRIRKRDARYVRKNRIVARLLGRPDHGADCVWSPYHKLLRKQLIAQEFTPNDFEMCRLDKDTERRLGRAIREMTAIVAKILLDPAFAVEAPWNDLLARAGWTPRAQIQEPCR